MRLIFPKDILIGNWNADYCHYGLLFELPDGVADTDVIKRSRRRILPVSSHGGLAGWPIRRASPNPDDRNRVIGIPRSWLILYGYLPVTVVFNQDKPAEIRNREKLMQEFWLEVPVDATQR